AGSVLDPQHVERDERERDRERVEEYELQRQRVRRAAEHAPREGGRGHQRRGKERPVERQQEEEDGARQPPARVVGIVVIPEAQERAVDAEPRRQFDERLDCAEQTENGVVLRRQVLDVDTEEQEVDDLDGDLAEAVDRGVLRKLPDLLEQRSALPEREQIE